MRVSVARTGLLLVAILAVGLSACLTSAPPRLSPEDLREPEGIAGAYVATIFPETDKEASALVESEGDRSYVLKITEGDHVDSPVHMRFLDLSSGVLLAVLTEDATPESAMYAFVTRASSGAWIFRGIDLRPEARKRAVQEVVQRHGGESLTFDSSDVTHDQIAGAFSAANLRALFTDPDFLQAIDTTRGFRLSRVNG